MKVFMTMKEVIIVVMMEYMDLFLKKLATISFKIAENVLVVIGEVDIGPIPATLNPVKQVNMVDFCLYLFF